jgi:SMC interacting uncharacterized protein involved in chromosome segregation
VKPRWNPLKVKSKEGKKMEEMEEKRAKIVEMLSRKIEWNKGKWERLNDKEQELKNTEERKQVMERKFHYLTVYTTTENILADVLRVLDGKI